MDMAESHVVSALANKRAEIAGKPDALVAGSQYRNARVGSEPAAERSARWGRQADGMKRWKETKGVLFR
jgi:hypothetical protein